MVGKDIVMLPHLTLCRQEHPWSCGPAAARTALGCLGIRTGMSDRQIHTLADDHERIHPGTCPTQMMQILSRFDGIKVHEAPEDGYPASEIRTMISLGMPVIAATSDWGGHWCVLVGYAGDGKDPESDVLVVADPYPALEHITPHMQLWTADRLISMADLGLFFSSGTFAEEECLVCNRKNQMKGGLMPISVTKDNVMKLNLFSHFEKRNDWNKIIIPGEPYAFSRQMGKRLCYVIPYAHHLHIRIWDVDGADSPVYNLDIPYSDIYIDMSNEIMIELHKDGNAPEKIKLKHLMMPNGGRK